MKELKFTPDQKQAFVDKELRAARAGKRGAEHKDIPESTLVGLIRWSFFGEMPGGFLKECLADKATAILKADKRNREHFHAIMSFIYNRMPSDSWAWTDPESWKEWKGLADKGMIHPPAGREQ